MIIDRSKGYVPKDQAVPGRVYEVHFDDCRIAGYFIATYLGQEPDKEDTPDEQVGDYVFDIGQISWSQSGFKLYEVGV